MKKNLQIILLILVACAYTTSYTQQKTQNPTEKITTEINIGFDVDKVLQEIQEFAQTINPSGPKDTLDERIAKAIEKSLNKLFYEIIGVNDVSILNPTTAALLKTNLPQANNVLISASIFTQDLMLAINLFSTIYSSLQKNLPQEVTPIFENLIKLGETITTSNDPADKATIEAIQKFIDQLNNIIATLRHNLETKNIVTFDAPSVLLPLEIAIDTIIPKIKTMIEKHISLVKTILNDAKKLTTQQLRAIDVAEKQIFKK